MIKKLKSTSGETITEVLIASLVVVLGVLLYTMMVQASFRIITKSEETMHNLYAAESTIEYSISTGEANSTILISGKTGLSVPDETINICVCETEDKDIKAYSFVKE